MKTIEFEVVTKDDSKRAFFVFNWEEGIYEFQIEKQPYKKEVLFSGDIEHLKETLERIKKEIKRNIHDRK